MYYKPVWQKTSCGKLDQLKMEIKEKEEEKIVKKQKTDVENGRGCKEKR